MPFPFRPDQLAAHGDAPALIVPGRPVVTYAQLAARVTEFAARLPDRKVLVGIEAAPSEHAVIAWLGAVAAGHAAALLPPGEPAALTSFQARFSPERVVRRHGGRWRMDEGGAAGPLHPDLSLILMTSGSTGHGKAVRLSGGAVAANAEAIAVYLGLTSADRAALVLPLHYSYGLSVLNSHLSVGASVVLGTGSILSPGLIDRLAETGATSLAGVPHSFELLEAIGFRDADLPELRTLTVAGGRMAPEEVRRWAGHMSRQGGRFFAMYGQTEATARIAYLPPERAIDRPDRIGVAIPGGELSLVDEAGAPVTDPEVVGELVYRGPNVMMGYGEDRADLARGPELDALATGDLAVRDTEGLYRIVGRRRRMSKIAGVRIGHDALEAALSDQGIAAAVVGDDATLLAVYAGARAPEEVRNRLAAAAGVSPRHARAERVDALPRLSTGKVDYEQLRARIAGPDVAPAGLVAAFRQAFFPHRVADGDSFASLGGDSLKHVELSMVLEQRLGRVPQGWERMPLAELARLEPGAPTGRQAVGSNLLVRAAAILMVVVQHATLWPIPGGSAAMVVLIGWGFARFQRSSLVSGDLRRFFRPLPLVLAPYLLIVAAYTAAWGKVPLASLFLVGNLGFADPGRHTMLPFLYWFVEAYAQTLLVWAAVFAVPPIRRFAGRDPFRFGMLFLAAAVAARFAVPPLWETGGRRIFTLPWVFYLSVFGWCAALADTRARRWAVVGAAAVVMPLVAWHGGNWIGSWIKFGTQVAVIGALAFLPVVSVPAWLARLVLPVAAASYHTYLVHRFVPEILMTPLEGLLPPALFTALAVTGGVAAGLLAFAAQRQAARLALRWTGRDRAEDPASPDGRPAALPTRP